MAYSDGILAAKAGTRRARVLLLGDSFVEGEGASTREERWADAFVAEQRAFHGLTGSGVGLTPSRYRTYLPSSDSWRFQATLGGTTSDSPYFVSQGNKGVMLDAGGWIEWDVDGTSATVLYCDGLGAGIGDLQVRVDGVLVDTITGNTSPLVPSSAHTFSLGAAVAHTVRFTAVGGAMIVDGIISHTTASDIEYWDSSHTGYQAHDFTVVDPGNLTYQDAWRDILQPDLIIDDLVGANEYLNDSGDNRTPAQVADEIDARLAFYDTFPSDPSVVILVPWTIPAIMFPNGLGYTVADYFDAALTVAAGYSRVAIVDLRTIYPVVDDDWVDADGLHPSNLGHEMLASAIADVFAVEIVDVAAPFAGGGSFTAAVVASAAVTASFAGGGTFTAAIVASVNVAAAFTGSGALTAAVHPMVDVAAEFAGQGMLTAVVSTVTGADVDAVFTGAGALSASVVPVGVVVASFTGSGVLTADVSAVGAVEVAAAFGGTGALTAAVLVVAGVSVTFTGAGEFSAVVTVVAQAVFPEHRTLELHAPHRTLEWSPR